MNHSLKHIEEFYSVYKIPQDVFISSNRKYLKIKLLLEEVAELEKALEDKSKIQIADALADIQYVLDGIILECGMLAEWEKIFDAVHVSNMSKFCFYDEAVDYCLFMKTKGVICEPIHIDGLYWVVMRNDNKILKGPKFKPPNFNFLKVCHESS